MGKKRRARDVLDDCVEGRRPARHWTRGVTLLRCHLELMGSSDLKSWLAGVLTHSPQRSHLCSLRKNETRAFFIAYLHARTSIVSWLVQKHFSKIRQRYVARHADADFLRRAGHVVE